MQAATARVDEMVPGGERRGGVVGIALHSAVETMGLRDHGQLHAVGGAELVKNACQVMLHRLFTDRELAGNVLVCTARDHPCRNFALTRRKRRLAWSWPRRGRHQ